MNLRPTQKEVADIIGATKSSIWNWEGNEPSPFWHHWGAIVGFQGHDPLPPPQTMAERLVRYRRLIGLSQKETARQLGIDQSTLAGWERGEHRPNRKNLDRVNAFLDGDLSDGPGAIKGPISENPPDRGKSKPARQRSIP
ncbi:MAG: helix-turn-helix transcriptional regulator [candidate division Zixibacteria bacterium]|nr:helix-turn-helix transcriptional regulator [candidate division Zixibacteria bacterium]